MDGVSIAASLLGLGTVGCQIAIKLYTLASQISTASQRISSVSNDISLTAGVLKELGEFMTQETATGSESIFSQTCLETTKTSAAICETIFNEIEQAAKEASVQLRTRDRIIGKIKLSKSEKAKWPFLQPSIDSLRIDLREAKGTLMLMLQLTNLAVSQRMATIHQTNTASIVEQREIYRAILAIQKQSQGDSSFRAKRPSLDGSGEGTTRVSPPPPLAIHTNPRKTSLRGEDMTSTSLPMAGQTSPLESYQTLIAMPDSPAPPESVLEASNKTPSLWSVDAIDKVRRNSMKSNSTRAALGGDKTSQPNATVDTQCEQRRDLSHFVIKSYILDDHSSPGAISLKFRLDRIPVRQVEIQKDLFSSEEDGHQSVLDAYLDLCDHERVLISNLIDCIDSHSSLKLLKRNYTDISHRGILIKGVPELRFIMERSRNDKQDNSDDGAISEAARRAECEAEIAAACQAAKAAVSIGYGPMELASTGVRRPSRDRSRYTSPADRSIDRHRPMSVQGDTISTPSSMYHPERFTPFRFKKPSEDHVEALEATEVLREDKQSDGSDESSIMSDDDVMNDEEAEKAVKELLEKYTTLGTVGRGSG